MICSSDLLPFSSLNAHFHFWSFVALLHSDLPACSSPLHVLFISDAYISTPHFQTFSSSRLFSGTLTMMLTTGQGCKSMLGTPKPLSPGSTNLKLKSGSSVELNSFCAFTSHPLSLPHHDSDFCWFGPRSHLPPQAAQSYPIISPRSNSHYFSLPSVDGDCAHRRHQLPSGSFY